MTLFSLSGIVSHLIPLYTDVGSWKQFLRIPTFLFHLEELQYDYALSLLLGYNLLSQTTLVHQYFCPLHMWIHIAFLQVFIPWMICMVSCLFYLPCSSSKPFGPCSTGLSIQQCLCLEQTWPSLKMKLI